MHRRLRRRISHRRMVRWLRTWRWPPDVVATTILVQPPRHGFSCAPSASDQQHSKPLHLLLPVFPSAPCHNIEISIFVRMMRKLKTPSFCLTRHRCRWRGRRRILIGATALDSLLFRSFLFVHLMVVQVGRCATWSSRAQGPADRVTVVVVQVGRSCSIKTWSSKHHRSAWYCIVISFVRSYPTLTLVFSFLHHPLVDQCR